MRRSMEKCFGKSDRNKSHFEGVKYDKYFGKLPKDFYKYDWFCGKTFRHEPKRKSELSAFRGIKFRQVFSILILTCAGMRIKWMCPISLSPPKSRVIFRSDFRRSFSRASFCKNGGTRWLRSDYNYGIDGNRSKQ